jgi:hypothetical protein
LHAIYQNGQPNQYQQAIRAVSEILLNYDYDKKVPVFGFGAKTRMPNLYSPIALHCFPCNGNPSNPEVFGLEGIEMVYKNVLMQLEFAGPTLFQPIIEETKKIADYCKAQGSFVYNILLILTGFFGFYIFFDNFIQINVELTQKISILNVYFF